MIRVVSILIALFLISFGDVYAMSTVKTWINQLRPGTFPTTVPESTIGAEQSAANGFQSTMPARATTPELTESEQQILFSLSKRKRELDQRDAALGQREEQLRILQNNVQGQVNDLKNLQSRIEKSMEAKKAQDAENLSKAIELYNGMEPRKAALQIEKLDPLVAVKIITGMQRRKAAAVLEAIPPQQAKSITEAIVRK